MIARKLQVCAALLAIAAMTVSPLYAQAPNGADAAPTQTTQGPQPVAVPPSTGVMNTTTTPLSFPPATFSIAPDYSHGRRWFPNLAAPYIPRHILLPPLTNSPLLAQLIQDGKLNLSLENAIALALQNNLDIQVQRYTPWLDEMNLLYARSGANGRVNFDPDVTMNLNEEDATIPVANPLISGVGVSNTTSSLTEHVTTGNFTYTQGFAPGTLVQMSFTNSRSSSSTSANVFNPSLQSTLAFTVTQPLLNGFGFLPNERFIIEDKNTVKVGEWQFKLAVINDVTTTEDDYWNLVYARQDVVVEQATVQVDQTLYDNNKKELAIGTMAPLDVLTAQSQLASDQSALIAAQTLQLNDQTKLLTDITKDPLAAPLAGVEIVPTTPIPLTDSVGNPTIDELVQRAWQDRPEMQEIDYTLKNDQIESKVTANALLPSLNLVGQYSTTGLSGISKETTVTQGTLTANTSEPILLNGSEVPNEFVGYIPTTTTVTAVPGGITDSWDDLIHSKFPTLQVGLQLNLPIRNRAAQANHGIAQLNERQEETTYQEEKNTVFYGVRTALTNVVQDRAAVQAAATAADLARQTFEDEQKKFQLGSSDAYTVALMSRDYTNAETVELQDEVSLAEAVVALDQAMGRTLETHNITITGASSPNVTPIPNIPGAPLPSNPATPNQ